MKIHIMSDLHREFNDRILQNGGRPFQPPKMDADVVVLAGDIDYGTRSFQWAEKTFPDVPIIYVRGNHEYYNGDFDQINRDFVIHSHQEFDRVKTSPFIWVGDYMFLNVTLWTDYNLLGDVHKAMTMANRAMMDHRIVTKNFGKKKFSPSDALECHEVEIRFLESSLEYLDHDPKKTIICTHHLPHPKCIHPQWEGSFLNPAFASDLTKLIEKYKPALWIHGHTHSSVDVMVGETRIVANPRGYDNGYEIENKDFNPTFVVEI